MLSQTGVYALQALLHLAHRGKGAQVAAAAMARDLGIPATYLAKVLQRLARERILESTRGPRGGYRLIAEPAALSVAAVVTPFQDFRVSERCLFGGVCDAANPCTAHPHRAAWNAAAREILEQTTLADLLEGTLEDSPPSPANPPSEHTR